jgi:hypothetical protein
VTPLITLKLHVKNSFTADKPVVLLSKVITISSERKMMCLVLNVWMVDGFWFD